MHLFINRGEKKQSTTGNKEERELVTEKSRTGDSVIIVYFKQIYLLSL